MSPADPTGCAMLDVAMHVDVVNTVVINRPVADVSQYAVDPDNVPQWYENIKSVEWKTPRPAQVGSRIDFVAHFLGRRLAYIYEVIEDADGDPESSGERCQVLVADESPSRDFGLADRRDGCGPRYR